MHMLVCTCIIQHISIVVNDVIAAPIPAAGTQQMTPAVAAKLSERQGVCAACTQPIRYIIHTCNTHTVHEHYW